MTVIPTWVEPPHEADGFSDLAPHPEIQVRADVADALLHRDLVAGVIEAVDHDAPALRRAHSQEQVERGGLPGSVGADEPVDGATRHREVEGTQAEFAERLGQAADLDGVRIHGFDSFEGLWRVSRTRDTISRSDRPACRAEAIAAWKSCAASAWRASRLRSRPVSATKVPSPCRR